MAEGLREISHSGSCNRKREGVTLIQMPQPSHNCFKESRIRKACMAIALLLSFFVLVQMLGVPVTLLNPFEAADTQSTSILEGFSVPTSLPQLTPLFKTNTATDAPPSIHLPILASVLFHPPVL